MPTMRLTSKHLMNLLDDPSPIHGLEYKFEVCMCGVLQIKMDQESSYNHIEEQLVNINNTYTLVAEATTMPAERIWSLMNYFDEEIRQQIRVCRDEVAELPHDQVKRALQQVLYQYEQRALTARTVLYLLMIKSKVQPHFNVGVFIVLLVTAFRFLWWLL